MEIGGQLSGQMAEMVGGAVETVGEEPEAESEGIPEQHEEEEEELTKVSCQITKHQVFFQLSGFCCKPSVLKQTIYQWD